MPSPPTRMSDAALRVAVVAELSARVDELSALSADLHRLSEHDEGGPVAAECADLRARVEQVWAQYAPLVAAVRAAGWGDTAPRGH